MSEAKNNVEALLKEIVIKNSSVSIRTVRDDDHLEDDLGFDSLSLLMTLSDLEDKFHVKIAVERIDEFRGLSFGELVRIVTEAMSHTTQRR